MLIGELAEKTGFSRDTIRYYEKLGLLGPQKSARVDNNYRHFDQSAVDTLAFIHHGKAMGMTLKEIKLFVEEWGKLNPGEIADYIDEKVAQLDSKITELEKFKEHLQEKKARLTASQN